MRINRKRKAWAFLPTLACYSVITLFSTGCKDLTGSHTLPSGVPDPATFKNTEGALQFARRAVGEFQRAYLETVGIGGMLTDELTTVIDPFDILVSLQAYVTLDRRATSEQVNINENPNTPSPFGSLNTARAYLRHALGQIDKYAVGVSPSVSGELHMLDGTITILLADLFCSGVPLSTLDFEADFTLGEPLSTAELYAHAIESLDTALALAAGTTSIENAAKILKARALMALARYDDAAVVLSGMTDTTAYRFQIGNNIWTMTMVQYGSVAELEGGTGYRFGSDSRTSIYTERPSNYGNVRRPTKYRNAGSMMTIADATELTLLRAELALRRGDIDEWLSALNSLRAPVADLPDLDDPGTDRSRLKMMFDERAAWLFLRGTRQGDLRRLVRNDQWSADDVYPSGLYRGTYLEYGLQVNLPVPPRERYNSRFQGCFDRHA